MDRLVVGAHRPAHGDDGAVGAPVRQLLALVEANTMQREAAIQ
jgi:hypothetical protein